jgi:hypothetical protein
VLADRRPSPDTAMVEMQNIKITGIILRGNIFTLNNAMPIMRYNKKFRLLMMKLQITCAMEKTNGFNGETRYCSKVEPQYARAPLFHLH